MARSAKIGLAILVAATARLAFGSSVTLAWNPSVSQNIAGYKLYYGVVSHTYTNSFSTGATSLTVSNLVDGQMYYFAATAYDTFGVESDFSSETNFLATSGRPVDTAPTISSIASQTLDPGTASAPLSFTIGDAESGPSALTVTASSSDKTFLPDANIVLGGSGGNRTVTVSPALSSGSATVTITVDDGTLSSASAFLVTVQTTPAPSPITGSLDLATTGDGTVSPNLNGAQLVQGKTYTFTAKPGKDQVFAGWSGDINSTAPRLTLRYDHPIHLRANFVPNPFIPVSGKYAGLFYETNGVALNSAGGLALNVNRRGSYSGKFQIGKSRYSFTGKLTTDLQATNTIQKGILPTVTVQFRLGTNDESDQLFGQLSGNGWVANLTGDRAIYNVRTNPAPQAGVYTIILPGGNSNSNAPMGHSFGSVKVNLNGNARFAGSLADGTRASQSAALSKFGTWPMSAILYGGQGALVSWLTFTNDTSMMTDISGRLSWIKGTVNNAKLYGSGFTLETDAIGSLYQKPAGGGSILSFTSGNLEMYGGNFASDTNLAVSVAGNKVFATDNTPTKLTFAPATGLFRGVTPDPLTGKNIKLAGAAFQKQELAAGMVMGTSETGWLVLTAPLQ